MKGLMLASVCVLVSVEVPLAADIAPPFYRGQPGAITAEWDFLTEGNRPDPRYGGTYPSPDGTSGISNNPWGGATRLSVYWPGYLPGVGPGPGGAWFLDNDELMSFEIPCGPCEDPCGEMRLQITFDTRSLPPVPFPFAWDGSVKISEFLVDLEDPCFPYWGVLVQDWRACPRDLVYFVNPTGSEPWSAVVSKIVIDATPDPLTVSVLAVGGVIIFRRRRVQK